MTLNNDSPANNYNQWTALDYIEDETPSTTFAETIDRPSPIFILDGVSIDGLFNLFSIFFLSTIALISAIVLASLPITASQLKTNLIGILVSVFLAGYAIILVLIILFYTIRFSIIFRTLYRNHERKFKIATFFAIIIIPSIVSSFLAASDENTVKIIGFSGLAIIALVLVVVQDIITELTRPYTLAISNWLRILIKKE